MVSLTHCVLISAVASSKECEINPSKEQKNAIVFGNWISWRAITITRLTEVTVVSKTSVHHERRVIGTPNVIKRFVFRPQITQIPFHKINPEFGSNSARLTIAIQTISWKAVAGFAGNAWRPFVFSYDQNQENGCLENYRAFAFEHLNTDQSQLT